MHTIHVLLDFLMKEVTEAANMYEDVVPSNFLGCHSESVIDFSKQNLLQWTPSPQLATDSFLHPKHARTFKSEMII